MNLNALLDVAGQRASSPLDRTVGDGAGAGAFADVLSQYGPENAGIPANDAAGRTEAAAPVDADGKATTPAAERALIGAAAAAISALDPTAQTGQALPATTAPTGQALPPDPAAVPLDGVTLPVASRPASDAADDATAGAIDPTAAIVAALIGAANAPLSAPAPPAQAPMAHAARTTPALASNTTQAAAASPSDTEAAAPTHDAAVAADADPALDPTAFDRIRAQLDRVQRRNETATADEPRRTQTAAAATTSAAAAVGGAMTPTLRALMRARDDAAPAAMNVARTARANVDGATSLTVKPVASEPIGVEANLRKDAPIARDDGDATIRIDATPARSGGADGLRDAAPARLGDLAQQHAQRFAGELADRVLVMRNQRLDGATVTLEPRDLGRIDIQVRLQADTTHVAFTAQHAAVRDALESQLPRLRSMLEEAGLSLGAVDVAHAGARDASGDPGAAHSYDAPRAATADGDAADAPAAWKPRAPTSLIDLHA